MIHLYGTVTHTHTLSFTHTHTHTLTSKQEYTEEVGALRHVVKEQNLSLSSLRCALEVHQQREGTMKNVCLWVVCGVVDVARKCVREMRFDLFILNICFISKLAFRLVGGSQCV